MVENKPDISVVLLCYRSEELALAFIDTLKKSLEKIGISWEMILVGNYVEGLADRTPSIIREIASQDSRIKAITKVKKGMMGWDMRCGLEAASGLTIAVLDGDGQVPLEDVVRVYEKLKRDDLDMVTTYRVTRGDGPYRWFLSRVYNLLFKIMFPGLISTDVNSKPKIFTEETLRKMELKSDDWFIDAEIMIQARHHNVSFSEIPTNFGELSSRNSFIKPAAIIEFIFNMIIFRLREFRYKGKK
jgi:glycosyltransferase involved in cell wall biosynthesis